MMGNNLSESDWESIRQFAQAPPSERSPEMLLGSPSDEDSVDEDTGRER